jgi:hypothetical protein
MIFLIGLTKKSLLPLNPLKETLATAILRTVLRQSLPFRGDLEGLAFWLVSVFVRPIWSFFWISKKKEKVFP